MRCMQHTGFWVCVCVKVSRRLQDAALLHDTCSIDAVLATAVAPSSGMCVVACCSSWLPLSTMLSTPPPPRAHRKHAGSSAAQLTHALTVENTQLKMLLQRDRCRLQGCCHDKSGRWAHGCVAISMTSTALCNDVANTHCLWRELSASDLRACMPSHHGPCCQGGVGAGLLSHACRCFRCHCRRCPGETPEYRWEPEASLHSASYVDGSREEDWTCAPLLVAFVRRALAGKWLPMPGEVNQLLGLPGHEGVCDRRGPVCN